MKIEKAQFILVMERSMISMEIKKVILLKQDIQVQPLITFPLETQRITYFNKSVI